MTQPLTIKLGEDVRYLRELQALLGITDEYGADPKAIRIAIKTCINLINNHRIEVGKVIPGLSANELNLVLPSIINLEKRKEITLKEEEARKTGQE